MRRKSDTNRKTIQKVNQMRKRKQIEIIDMKKKTDRKSRYEKKIRQKGDEKAWELRYYLQQASLLQS